MALLGSSGVVKKRDTIQGVASDHLTSRGWSIKSIPHPDPDVAHLKITMAVHDEVLVRLVCDPQIGFTSKDVEEIRKVFDTIEVPDDFEVAPAEVDYAPSWGNPDYGLSPGVIRALAGKTDPAPEPVEVEFRVLKNRDPK
jgi:hypothetical protein